MTTQIPPFSELGLHEDVLRALHDVGYEVPTPIQAQTIPPLLEGRDVLGQAQTGTGKTAAFALPVLSRIDIGQRLPQTLVLAPTRELALQVAEAMQKYAAHLDGFRVLPVYGGTGFQGQLRALKRGVHVIVGTPGRVMDHMRRGTLDLSELDTLVLDEADEMLRMGFIDDVKWILEHAPEDRRIALFSATMPPVIRRIAREHLRDPIEIRIEQATRTAETVTQRFRIVPHHHKVDVLTRVLESEPYDGMLIFVRTRNGAVELSDKLTARGIACDALNGDVPQHRREQIVNQLKAGKIDVLVATDVAARGLDVERLTHVINYDPPHDSEAYVHRIGRTGRAGREGQAILFLTPREKHIARSIERSTGQKMTKLMLPTTEEVNAQRLARYREQITEAIGSEDAAPFREIVAELIAQDHDPVDVAAAIALVGQGDDPLLLEAPPKWERDAIAWRERHRKGEHQRSDARKREEKFRERPGKPGPGGKGEPMETFRVAVGYRDGLRPGNLVGAITAEAGLEGRFIGQIDIRTDYALVELPTGMPNELLRLMQGVRVCGKRLEMKRTDERASKNRFAGARGKKGPKKGGKGTAKRFANKGKRTKSSGPRSE